MNSNRVGFVICFGTGFIGGAVAMYFYIKRVIENEEFLSPSKVATEELVVEDAPEMPVEGHRIASDDRSDKDWGTSAMSTSERMIAEINAVKDLVNSRAYSGRIDYSRPHISREEDNPTVVEDSTNGYSFVSESEATDIVGGGELSESIDLVYFSADDTWTEQNDIFDSLTPDSIEDCIGNKNYEAILDAAGRIEESGKCDYYLYNAADLSLVSITISEGAWADIRAYGPVGFGRGAKEI